MLSTLPFLGETAALVTSLCWATASVIFAAVGTRVGAHVVNRTRILFAFVMLVGLHTVLTGSPLPASATPEQWGWLAVSAVFGLVIGDTLVYTAYVLIGPRLATLMMAMVPIFGALADWLLFGQLLLPLQSFGIFLGVAGIMTVVGDRQSSRADTPDPRTFRLGLLCGIGGAAGQVIHLMSVKYALEAGLAPLSATLIRTFIATALLWGLAIFTGGIVATVRAWGDRRVLWPMAAGSLIGPVIGIWLSIVAVKLAPVGIASTLMALPPVLLIPYDIFVRKRRVSALSIAGTLAALTGVAVLFNA